MFMQVCSQLIVTLLCNTLIVKKQHKTSLKTQVIEWAVGVPRLPATGGREAGITDACEELSFLHNGKLADQFVLPDSWTATSCGSKSSLARLMPFRDTITLPQLEAGLAVALFTLQIFSSREENILNPSVKSPSHHRCIQTIRHCFEQRLCF